MNSNQKTTQKNAVSTLKKRLAEPARHHPPLAPCNLVTMSPVFCPLVTLSPRNLVPVFVPLAPAPAPSPLRLEKTNCETVKLWTHIKDNGINRIRAFD